MSRPRIIVLGETGFLGSILKERLQNKKYFLRAVGRSELDLSKPIPAEFVETLKSGAFDYAIICAALTDVEACHLNPTLSHQINVTGMIQLFELLRQLKVVPIFFSSDYVFSNAPGPRGEKDPCLPQTVYGKQKRAAEQYLEQYFERYLIFRTSKLMSLTMHPRNILFPIVKNLSAGNEIHCFSDQWVNPVFAEDINEIVAGAIEKELNGLFHLGSRRIFTRLELALFLASKLGLDTAKVRAIRIADLGLSEPRPTHNILDCGKIEKALGFQFTELEEVLDTIKKWTKK